MSKSQKGNQKDVVMEFVQNLAETLQMDPNEIIAISKQYPEILEKTVKTYQDNKEDIQKAAQTFTQELQTKIQAKRHGSKLNYVKSLKNQCADDEELYYYKKGGSVGCGCKKKNKEIKKDCGGSQMKLKVGNKVKSAGAGCIAKFKMHKQGGNLIKKYQNAGTLTYSTPTGTIVTPGLVNFNKLKQENSIKIPNLGTTFRPQYQSNVVQNMEFKTPEFDPNAGYDEAYNRYRQELWSSGKRINPKKAEKKFIEMWNADENERRQQFNDRLSSWSQMGPAAQRFYQLMRDNQRQRTVDPLIENVRRDLNAISTNAANDINQMRNQSTTVVPASPVQRFNNNYWLSKANEYGFNTIDELKAWQEKNGLDPDGKMGNLSIAKYNELNQSNNSGNSGNYTALSHPITAIVNATGNFLRNGTPEEEVSWGSHPITWAITKLGQRLRK